MGTAEPGAAPGLISFIAGGQVLWSRPSVVLTGPDSYSIVATGHGEWIQTGRRQFDVTALFLAGDSGHEFTTLIKVAETITLSRNSEEFTQTGTLSAYDVDGNLLFSRPSPITHGKRIVAGQ